MGSRVKIECDDEGDGGSGEISRQTLGDAAAAATEVTDAGSEAVVLPGGKRPAFCSVDDDQGASHGSEAADEAAHNGNNSGTHEEQRTSGSMRVSSSKVRLGTGPDADMSRSEEGTDAAEHASFAETLQHETQQVVELNGEAGVASEGSDAQKEMDQRLSEGVRYPPLKVPLGTGSGVDMSRSEETTEAAEHASFAETLQRETQQIVELNGEAGVASEGSDAHEGMEQRTIERVRVPSLKVRLGTGSGVDMPQSKKRTEEAEHASFAETLQRETQQVVELNGKAGVANEGSDAHKGTEQRTSKRVRVPSLKVRLGTGSGIDMPHSKKDTEEAEHASFTDTLQRETQQVVELNGEGRVSSGESNMHDNQTGSEKRMSKRVRVLSLKLRLGADPGANMTHSTRRKDGAEEAEPTLCAETIHHTAQQVVGINGATVLGSEAGDKQQGNEQRTSERVRVPSLKVRLGVSSGVDTPHSKRRRGGAEEAGPMSCAKTVHRKAEQVTELNGAARVASEGSDRQNNRGGEERGSKPDGDTIAVESAEENKERVWTLPMKLVLVQLAREFRPFRVADRKATVADQWTLLHAKVLAEEGRPIGNALAGVSKSRLSSQFNLLLKYQRKGKEQAHLSSRGNSKQTEGQEADLGKTMEDTLDAIHADLFAKMTEEDKHKYVLANPDMHNAAKMTQKESKLGQVRACPGVPNSRGVPRRGARKGKPFGLSFRGRGGGSRNFGEDCSQSSSKVVGESDTADPGNEDPDNQDPDTADPDNQDPGDEDSGNEDPDNRDPDNQDSATEDLEAASGDMEMGGGADRKKGKGRPESKGGQVVRIRKTTPNLRDLDNAAGESGLLAFLQESVSQSSIDRRARWKKDRDHSDKVRRLEWEEDRKTRAETKRLDTEAFVARQEALRLRENDRREQDRLDRKMEYEETWKLEEARRAHELKVLEAQIELARCRST